MGGLACTRSVRKTSQGRQTRKWKEGGGSLCTCIRAFLGLDKGSGTGPCDSPCFSETCCWTDATPAPAETKHNGPLLVPGRNMGVARAAIKKISLCNLPTKDATHELLEKENPLQPTTLGALCVAENIRWYQQMDRIPRLLLSDMVP